MIQDTQHFITYYNQMNVTKCSYEAFRKLDIRFQIGVYLSYAQSKGYSLSSSDIGYKMRRNYDYKLATVEDADKNKTMPYVLEHVIETEERKGIFSVWVLAIQAMLNYISKT